MVGGLANKNWIGSKLERPAERAKEKATPNANEPYFL